MVVIITAYLLYTVREGCSNAAAVCGSTIHQIGGVVFTKTNIKSTEKDNQTRFKKPKKKKKEKGKKIISHPLVQKHSMQVLSRKKKI